MVEQPLAKLRDQSLDQVADGVVLPEKEKPLEPEDDDQTQADQEILFEFGFSSVDDAVDDVFGVIDRGAVKMLKPPMQIRLKRIRPL